MIRTAIITISDKGSRGEREDVTGRILSELLKNKGYEIKYYRVIPDEFEMIKTELIALCDSGEIDLIITNGGTGFSKRDVTPEATIKVIEKYVPGIGEAMRANSFKITPNTILSRGIAGIRKNTLIINLPGSPKGALENLNVILPAIPHGIEILSGQASECARL